MKSSLKSYLWLIALGVGYIGCEEEIASTKVTEPRDSSSLEPKDYYMVFFKDKRGTPYEVSRPEALFSERALLRRRRSGVEVVAQDLPPTPAYVLGIEELGPRVYARTRWMNGILVGGTEEQLRKTEQLNYVDSALWVAPHTIPPYKASTQRAETVNIPSAPSLNQEQRKKLGIDLMHRGGFKGKGIYCAVIDASFWGVARSPHFEHLFREDRIVDTYSWLHHDERVYGARSERSHGAMVLSIMAAVDKEGRYRGAAHEAHYALYETENESSEHPIEEYNWLFAAERADSIGIDIITSSLGYEYFSRYTSSQEEYLDGRVSVVSFAAKAAYKRGILVINGVGNEGEKGILTPANVEEVLSVGSVDDDLSRLSFSSVGPRSDQLIKPDLVAPGFLWCVAPLPNGNETYRYTSGTSFSTPLVAGLAAGLWQSLPERSHQEIARLLRNSGHQAPMPDNQIGYGIPHFERAHTTSP